MSGLLSEMLKGTPLAKTGVMPKLVGNEIVIEITEEQLKQIAFQGIKPEILKHIDLKIVNGKVIMKIRLF